VVAVLQHIGLVFFYIVLFAFNLLIFLGVPGGWVALVAILIFDIATGFSTVGWVLLLVMAGIAVCGEVIESVLGLVYVAHKGATKWGVLGAFVGGLVGAIGGTAVFPFIGSIIFGLLGAFAGAVIFEYVYYKSLDRALQTGFFAFIGKISAMLVKFALGLVILGIFIYRSWR
jgi:uncharacterized protein YqgC (DUF456 family)